ncbi:MAG TPA: Fe3+-siderophore ABC transporter permease [Flavobacteriales bacterium]|nr:Fe3+-siderophore ABC transporter permease [Flavobacteriales bacterium]HRE74296.1 iron ABC transporter permease [Flavobacteriales bacterium]HRJ36172.1 iron ABC transporter permease [Flavobacteriales bacterium]HRJ39114.1 iron ABC transporter permease [Flavobacteriales bacterium]
MRKPTHILLVLAVLLLGSIVASCALGAVKVHPTEFVSILLNKFGWSDYNSFSAQQEAVIWVIRLPRVITSVLSGALLALSGVAIQGLFRNPLADPGIIGISSGAAMVASIAIVISGTFSFLQGTFAGISFLVIAAFAGSLLSAAGVFRIAREKTKTNVSTMLLAGIAINAIAGAVTGILIYISNEQQLRDLTFWTLGSLGGSTWTNAGILLVLLVVTYLVFFRLSKALNAFSLGEQEAQHIGISIESAKNRIIIFSSIAVGATVAFNGIIGFVGLVVPHILRITGSYNHRFLIPAAALGGGLLLSLSDLAARTLVAPAEIPVGIITALAGAPVFLFILLQQKHTFR